MFYKTKVINGISTVVQKSDRAASLYDFKQSFPYVFGESDQNVSYFEVAGVTLPPELIFYGDTGTTQGGITFPSDGLVFENFTTTDPEMQAIEEQDFLDELNTEILLEQSELVGSILDPRYHPDIPLVTLQKIKETEADNDFEVDGLGTVSTVTFERDSGLLEAMSFDTRKNTIVDLQMVKSYKDLNMSIVNTNGQSSVNVTNIQVIDSTGQIFSLSPTEFDRMFYGVVEMYYEQYISRSIMKNLISGPSGSSESEMKNYLNDSLIVSFAAAKSSDDAAIFTGKSISPSAGK